MVVYVFLVKPSLLGGKRVYEGEARRRWRANNPQVLSRSCVILLLWFRHSLEGGNPDSLQLDSCLHWNDRDGYTGSDTKGRMATSGRNGFDKSDANTYLRATDGVSQLLCRNDKKRRSEGWRCERMPIDQYLLFACFML